jgi:hypothetical protein
MSHHILCTAISYARGQQIQQLCTLLDGQKQLPVVQLERGVLWWQSQNAKVSVVTNILTLRTAGRRYDDTFIK